MVFQKSQPPSINEAGAHIKKRIRICALQKTPEDFSQIKGSPKCIVWNEYHHYLITIITIIIAIIIIIIILIIILIIIFIIVVIINTIITIGV